MNVAVTKTKAEQGFAQAFEAVAEALPGGIEAGEARKAAIGVFSTHGLPGARLEDWKWTDLRVRLKEAHAPRLGGESAATNDEVESALGALAGLDAARVVFVNGVHRADLSTGDQMAGVEVEALAAGLSGPSATRLLEASADGQDASVLALNSAFATDGAVVRVAKDAQRERPLLLVYASAGSEPGLITVRNHIEIEAGAKVSLIEAFVTLDGAASGQVNTLSNITVADKADVAHIKCTIGTGACTHLASWSVALGADASYRGFQLTQGTGLARNNIKVCFGGENTKLDLSGAFLARGKEHIDTTLVVDHAVPLCESRELFKGVLDDEARGIFQGKIIVRPDAQKTDGKQMSQALMLSPIAEFDSKPELEIYADDVVCGHGATSAEIDEDLLFYCRARGIPEDVARALLTESFIGEAIEAVEDEAIAGALMDLARGWLRKE